MAEMSDTSKLEPSGAKDLTEQIEEQSNSKKIEEFMEMVENMQQENLDPWIKDLVNRIKEFQKLKQKTKEEMQQARDLWQTKQKELDSLDVEQLYLEDVLRKKQESLRIIVMQCNEAGNDSQRRWFEEETKKVEEFLEATIKQRQQLQYKRQRIMAEMEKLDLEFISDTYTISEEDTTDTEEIEHLPQTTPGP